MKRELWRSLALTQAGLSSAFGILGHTVHGGLYIPAVAWFVSSVMLWLRSTSAGDDR